MGYSGLSLSLFRVQDPVATYNDLPITGNVENNLRLTQDTDKLYTWSIAATSGSLSDWKEIIIASLDEVSDGFTYGKVKLSELLSGKVLSLNSMVTTDGVPSYTLSISIIPNDAESLLDLGSLLKYFQSIYSDDIRINTLRSLDASVAANAEDIIEASTLKHSQNTDTKLDEGGANEITAETIITEINDLKYIQLNTPNLDLDNYTLVLTDVGKFIDMDKATAVTLTVPLNSSVAFPIGTQIIIRQKGVGQVTVTPIGGVTLNNANGLITYGQYSVVALIKLATDTWAIFGDTTT